MHSLRTLAEWFGRRAWLSPDTPALTFMGRTATYAQMHDRIARLATVLSDHGVSNGDRVSYLGANHPDAFVLMFAASMVGAVHVPLNIRLSSAELGFIVDNADVRFVLAEPGCTALIEGLRSARADMTCLTITAPTAGWLDAEALIAAAAPRTEHAPSGPDDLAAIVYTSGTTGRPKGAMLTHRCLWSNDLNYIMAFDVASTDVALVVAPVFHVGGLFVLTTATWMMGGHVVLASGFVAGEAIEAIEAHGVTVTFGVPAMMLFMSEHERFDAANLSSLRLYVAGGAPVPEPILHRYAARGIPVSQCYGLSESTSATVYLETVRALEKLGSAGRAMMMAEIRLIDADGLPLDQPDVRGEICARGGNVSPGYWGNPDATAAAIDADGWLRTGDVGYLDAEGFLFVVDRVKDMIITGGENVYPAEIESLLFEHPAIANVSVIGRPDDRWGERVVAVVVVRDGHDLDLDQVHAFCADRLARYKVPRELVTMDELPLNASGKVVKTTLRTMILETA